MSEAKREYDRQWRRDNAEKLREQDRVRYAANPAKRLAQVKAWRERNPGYARAWHAKNKRAAVELDAKIADMKAKRLNEALDVCVQMSQKPENDPCETRNAIR